MECCLAAKVLEAHGAPTRALDVWQEGLRRTLALDAARHACGTVFTAREDRKGAMALISGRSGTGKTVAVVAALGEALGEALRRRAAGTLAMDSARTHLTPEAITPERVRRVLGLDWDSYQANERLNPGVCAAQVQAAFANESGWDYASSPLTFAFWRAAARATAPLYGKEAERELAHARTCDILALDDLGAEHMGENSPWRAVVDDLVDARYSLNLVTVVTTNLRLQDFAKRYRQRVVDRFAEAGAVVEDPSPSLRGRGGP